MFTRRLPCLLGSNNATLSYSRGQEGRAAESQK